MLSVYGGMAELVDALDSKSCGLRPCQFESDYPYQLLTPRNRSFFCICTTQKNYLYHIDYTKKKANFG